MPPAAVHRPLLPSFFDRFTDRKTAEQFRGQRYDFTDVEEGIKRNLENLLNTRQTITDFAEELDLLPGSILGYGLPDLSSFQPLNEQQLHDLGAEIQKPSNTSSRGCSMSAFR